MKDGALSRPLNEQRPDFTIAVLDHRTDTNANPRPPSHLSRVYERSGGLVWTSKESFSFARPVRRQQAKMLIAAQITT